MIPNEPPRWLERMLLHFLPARHRETISGDLLEEYREEQAPRLGSRRANVWYLCQTLSLICAMSLPRLSFKRPLMCVSAFSAAAGIWLAVMENILKHPGYGGRTLMAAVIAIQSAATLMLPVRKSGAIFRRLVLTGAIALGLFGASAIERVLRAPHFEGFVLLIGLALMAQGALALLAVLQSAPEPRHH